MPETPDTLPPLEWIRVFEAAARLNSFSAAATELSLTQAAVSQRIRNLELRLGTQLFNRHPRGVTLSTQGEAWFPHVEAALAQLGRSTADLFAAPRSKVTLAASGSVIELWLLPRLAGLRARLPNVQLAFETVQNLPDYDRTDADLEIRFGAGHWAGRQARRLFREELAPVAAPALLDPAKDWRDLPLIAVSGPRPGWRDWFSACGMDPPPAPWMRFDTFAQGAEAALAGAGVLLASLPLCAPMIRAGRLERLTTGALVIEEGYWIAWPEKARASPAREMVIEACLTGWPD